MELGVDILRCECRLYPNLFPKRTFNIADSMFKEFKLNINIFNPYKLLSDKLAVIINEINNSQQTIEKYVQAKFLKINPKNNFFFFLDYKRFKRFACQMFNDSNNVVYRFI